MNFELGLVIRKSGGDAWNSCDRRLRFIVNDVLVSCMLSGESAELPGQPLLHSLRPDGLP
jgi:hypothetical protein